MAEEARQVRMKLTQQQIKGLSEEIVSEIEKRRTAELLMPKEQAAAIAGQAITEDLQAEDRLNEEVKDILKQFSKEIEQGRADYKTMFDLVKKKLVRERGLVL